MKDTDIFLKVNKNYFCLNLKSIDILMIAQIEEFHRNSCECYMTNEQFSIMFGESESTIKRVIDKLEKLNIIQRSTKFINGNGKGTKQRILSINDHNFWKVQNELTNKCKVQNQEMEGSKIDNGRFKNKECKVHNGPIKEKEKENKKKTLKENEEEIANANKVNGSLRSQPKKIEDLSDAEANEIIRRLSKTNPDRFPDLQKEYNLEFGVLRDFKKKWNKLKSERAYWIEQEVEREKRKNEPHIDFDRLYKCREKTEEELKVEREREKAFNELYNDLYVKPCEEINYDEPSEALKMLAAMQKDDEYKDIWG